MGYAVLHLDKSPGGEAAMTDHIERKVIHSNVDSSRTYLNQELIDHPDEVADRTEAIQHRLDTANLERKIGKNQVQVIRVMLTGSHEDMLRIQSEGRLDEWCADNLNWLRKTYGTDNVVAATLHQDEATPHIHASVVPIVTGERRKTRTKKQDDKAEHDSGKKKYRKKDPNRPRLCVDDVMARDKLVEYQDTYAEAMAKYGLERGVRGSDARHITTQEFYRNAIAKKGNLQENIEELLKVEEMKRQTVEQLKEQEQEATARYWQADTLKQQKESELSQTEKELKEVKGQLKTEKFRSSAADAGSAIMDGISSALGTSKVKRQQQEIDNLKSENQNQQQKITVLNQTINRERKEHEKVSGELKSELNKIHEWLPDTPNLIKWGEHCKSIGFSDKQAKDLVNKKTILFTGELYSNEHYQRFKADDVVVRLEKDPTQGFLKLLIDKTNIIQWFRQKYKEFQEKRGIKIPEKNRQQGQGMKP
ncbi:MAG: plasmid recombination protein [Rikenellaceae bacterium]|nr:plasmid recombination protein [Rikenellaceae bacterium]